MNTVATSTIPGIQKHAIARWRSARSELGSTAGAGVLLGAGDHAALEKLVPLARSRPGRVEEMPAARAEPERLQELP
jgi:hypothetical protein